MKNRSLTAVLALSTAALLSSPVQAWWHPWYGPGGQGPWGGYNAWGPVNGFMDGDFNMSFSSRAYGRGYGHGYGRGYHGYGYGYPRSYPAPVIWYLPAAMPAVNAAQVIADGDGDGVADNRDLCPDTPTGTRVDFTGCVAARPITLRGVNFKLDSAELTPASSAILDRVARTLSSHPEVTVEVGGHTDSQGDDAYNLDLSARRAATVVGYLIEHGVAADKLTSRGYGETRLIDTADTAAAHATNRRVELTRTDSPGAAP